MELKLICQCGQKYKFDVQPVNGRMPFTVNCPICNRDGTAAANDMLARGLTAPPLVMQPSVSTVSSAPPPPPPGMFAPSPLPHQAAAAPMPVGYTPPPPPPVSPAAGGLSIHRAQASAATAIPPLAAPGSVAPPPITGRPSVQAQQQRKAKESGQFSMGLGIAGGVGGALIGSGLMYAFWIWAHFRFPIMGVLVGAFAGYGARLLARGTDNTLGIITAVAAGTMVTGTYYLMYGDFVLFNIISIVICCGVAYRAASG